MVGTVLAGIGAAKHGGTASVGRRLRLARLARSASSRRWHPRQSDMTGLEHMGGGGHMDHMRGLAGDMPRRHHH